MRRHASLSLQLRRLGSLSALLLALLPPAARADTPAFTWVEGEAASVAPAGFKPEIGDVGAPTLLSGGKWLHVSVTGGDMANVLPDSGIVLSYPFSVPRQAAYEIWNRLGYEAVRSPFDWRVDGGAWRTVAPADQTIDLEQLQTWNPVAWLKMATQPLAGGAHTLDIRLLKHKDSKGNWAAVNYASDAICVSAGPFHPNDGFKPGDTGWMTAGDKAAAAQAFPVPIPDGAAQTSVPLTGDWQIARWDEGAVSDAAAPIAAAPPADVLFWKSMPVPGNRDAARPEWLYSHRYFLRTRVNVPAGLTGRSFFLHFPAVSMIASVFVNGQLCGTTKAPFAVWDCDITHAVRPGGVNEVWVGIKDWYYAIPLIKGTDGAQYVNYIPTDWVTKFGPAPFTFPVWGHEASGILRAPSLVVAGRAYVSDVFALPSVKSKTLGLEVGVTNPTAGPLTVTLGNSIVPLTGGAAEKTFGPQEVTVPAGQTAVVQLSEAWADPKLWWPDSPTQYNVVSTLSIGGQAMDARTTKFGFREWDWHGPNFTLNGVPWHGRADLSHYNEATEAAVAAWRKHGQTMERMWTEDAVSGLEPEAALDFYDAHGIPIRRTDIFDGEAVKYDMNVPGLFDNWRTQLAAWVKGQRNHPSVFLWSMENEITFINSHVFGQDNISTREMKKAWDVVRAVDPTRPAMTDGGNALLDESLPVYGGHYMTPPFASLPEGAYDKAGLAHRQVWPITQVKPILFGEDFFAPGNEPADLATVGGEAAFVGKAESHPAVGEIARMLSEGYRWNDINFHFWMGGESDLYYNSWQPLAVICRQSDSTFRAGQRVTRPLGIFNDTHTAQPITLTWTLALGGKKFASEHSLHTVAAGGSDKFSVVVPMPAVAARQDGTWTLALSVGGKPVFTDVKPISVLSPTFKSAYGKPPRPNSGEPEGGLGDILSDSGSREVGRGGLSPVSYSVNAAPQSTAVFDPSGAVPAFLAGAHVPFTKIARLRDAPSAARVLVIGPDALTLAQSTSSQLAAYAATGRTVIVLEQKNPLKFQALPGEMAPDTNAGGIAFLEDATSPVLRGLESRDFFAWGLDGLVYRNAYAKPTAGGKSLIQCSDKLADTALAQMTVGKGNLLLSQLLVGRKLATNAVAQQLLLNMIAYGRDYKQVFHPVFAAAGDNAPLLKAMDATGLRYSQGGDPLSALNKPGGIAVIDASPANLKALAGTPSKVNAFTRGGGWIVFNHLTPEGLADYNKIVGVGHLIRPFRQEKVTWPAARSPLTAGLATSNVVMGSGQQIFGWSAGQYPDTDAYGYVLDYDEVAPFGKSSFFAWDKITNNYTQADGFWPLIINFPGPALGKTTDIPISLPRPEKITQFTYVQDLNYNPTTKIALVFNGTDKIPLDVQPNGDPQTFVISPPRTAKDITLQIVDYTRRVDGNTNVGLDNIYLKAARPASFYQKVKPMLNIGALLEYPRGAGGIVLCNVKYKDSESNPENAGKKQAILAAILRNLGAPFSGGKTIIAGANDLTYTPVNISKRANQYVTDQGWFGDKAFTFADLPRGRQPFAGVAYNVYNFTTSPVPNIIMLGGNGVPGNPPDHMDGIPVNQKADALFFLQAARIDQRRSADEIKQGKKYEMADYVVHYADGTTARVPVYAEIGVDDYKQKTPAALPGAQIAWTKPYAGTDQSAVAYSMQWNNPSPGKAITTIDFVYGPDRRGVPALLALTAASAR